MQNQNSQPSTQKSWTASDLKTIADTLAVLINGQKSYGKDYSLKDTLAYWRMKLDGRFSASQVLQAVSIYTDQKNDIPAPADLIQIINPPPRKITYAEYKHALEQLKANNFPIYSEHRDTIKAYQQQDEPEPIEGDRVAIGHDEVLQISHED